MNTINQIISELFDKNNLHKDLLLDKISKYKKQYPYDPDMYLLEGYYYLLQGCVLKAKESLKLSLKYNPYSIDTYFLLGDVFILEKEYCEAVRYYSLAMYMNEKIRQPCIFFNSHLWGEKIAKAEKHLENMVNSGKIKIQDVKILNYQMKHNFEISDNILNTNYNYIGENLYLHNGEVWFGAYADITEGFIDHMDLLPKNLMRCKAEILKVYVEKNSLSVLTNEKVLLPVASKKPENNISFMFESGKIIKVRQNNINTFSYFRIEENTEITSEYPMIIGTPIALKHEIPRKKLIISFFVDGLSQKLLQEAGFEDVMPNTFRFFKKGLICSNFFTTSDWTYPSLASFVSGVTLPEHMMFHPQVNKKLPEDRKIVFEYLKDAGYYTSMINADGRSSATYGYIRGIDRYIARHALYYRGSQTIADAIEHIETFKETDQYLWLAYNDLHDIADDLDVPAVLQAHMDMEICAAEEKSITSVKQSSSLRKRQRYIKALKTADLRFQMLYDYLERNYNDDEYIVTMFGDHGQTYLLQPGEHHLSRYHSNAAFMVRGGERDNYKRGLCEEYISAIDYPNILCRLANVKEPISDTQGNLPKVFGGMEERQYTITETIHPNDPYEVAIHAKDHIFYLTTENRITEYGRLDVGNYDSRLSDLSGKTIYNSELTNFYLKLTGERLKYIINY